MAAERTRDFVVGQSIQVVREVTEADITMFGELSGDRNPVHFDEEYAQASVFGGRIAHGMLSACFVSSVLGMQLPGPGGIYREQTLSFLAPVRIGDQLTVKVEVVEVGRKGKSLRLQTTCTNQNGTLVLDGMATVLLPRNR